MDKTGSRIRARRMDAKIAQRDLALSVGISPSYLNLIEHDRRRIGGKLLGQIAAALDLEPDLLSQGADAALVTQMRAAAAGSGDSAVETALAADLAARYPGWARLIAAQGRQITLLDQRTRMLSDRLTHDPALSEALHGVISAVTSIQSTAAILIGDSPVDADWQARFHRNIHDDARRLAQTSAALIAYFDTPADGLPTSLAPIEELEQALSLTGFHRAALEQPQPEVPAADVALPVAVADMLASYDAHYLADAAALPLAPFQAAAAAVDHDPLRLSGQCGRPLAQILRRLAVLPPKRDTPPLALMICDAAGAPRLIKSVPGVALTRGALCPLWPIFTAMGQPGRPVVAQVSQSDSDGRVDCWAIADTRPHPGGPHMPPLIEAVMLLRPGVSAGPVPPVPVGPGCRQCARTDCPARREPAAVTLAKAF